MQRKRAFADYADSEAALREASEPVGRAGRRLGRGRGAPGRDPDRRRVPRQHRRVLAAEAAAGRRARTPLRLPPALVRPTTPGSRTWPSWRSTRIGAAARKPATRLVVIDSPAAACETWPTTPSRASRSLRRKRQRRAMSWRYRQPGSGRLAHEFELRARRRAQHRTARACCRRRARAAVGNLAVPMDAVTGVHAAPMPSARRRRRARCFRPEAPLAMPMQSLRARHACHPGRCRPRRAAMAWRRGCVLGGAGAADAGRRLPDLVGAARQRHRRARSAAAGAVRGAVRVDRAGLRRRARRLRADRCRGAVRGSGCRSTGRCRHWRRAPRC